MAGRRGRSGGPRRRRGSRTADTSGGGDDAIVYLQDLDGDGTANGPGEAYCFGDGSGGVCPCGNFGGPGGGCLTSALTGAVLSAQGSAKVTSNSLVLTVSGALPGQPGLVFAGHSAVQVPFGDGLRCAGVNAIRFPPHVADAGGSYQQGDIASHLGVTAGDTRYFQGWFRDVSGICGSGFNLTNGYSITFVQ